MQRHTAVAVALAVLLITVSGTAGVASAGAAPSWNTNEPLQIPEDRSQTITLTVYDDINDESVDEVATITPVGGLEHHVHIEHDEIHFDGVGDSQQIEIVVDPDLDEGDTSGGSLILEHGQQTENGISSVGMQYSFDITIEAGEPEGGLLSGTSLLVILALFMFGILYAVRKRMQKSNESGLQL